jgi:dienelactone hydrolase
MSVTETMMSGTQYANESTTSTLLYNIKTKAAKQVFPNATVNVRGPPQQVTHENGHTYGYFRGVYFGLTEELRRISLIRVDLDTYQITEAYLAPNGTRGLATDRNANVVARVEVYNHGQEWRLVKGADGEQVLASGKSLVGSPRLEAFGRTADSVIISNPEDGDFGPPREVSLSTGKISGPLIDGAPGGVIHDPKTYLAIGVAAGGYVRDLLFFDPKVDAKWQGLQAAFPGEHVGLRGFDDDLDKWLVFVEGPHDSGRYFLVDLTSNKATLIGAPYPQIKPDQVGTFDWFDYTARDGTKLKGVLTLPPGRTAKNLPFVMLPHGGPGNGSYDEPRFDWWAQALASRGYAVFQPDFRGSGGLGKSFERVGWGQWGRIMETDVSDAIPALAAAGIIDPKRGCIVGWSYGGYATLAGVTVQNGLYKCAVAGGAVSDMGGMLQDAKDHSESNLSEGVRYWKLAMGLKSTDDPMANAYSPAKLANRADAPILLIHGHDDTTVPIAQAYEMQSALKAAGKPVELLELPGSYHYIGNPLAQGRDKMLTALVAWVEKYNPSDLKPEVTVDKGQSTTGN